MGFNDAELVLRGAANLVAVAVTAFKFECVHFHGMHVRVWRAFLNLKKMGLISNTRWIHRPQELEAVTSGALFTPLGVFPHPADD